MTDQRIDERRVTLLHPGSRVGRGPVVYWMHREHRARDNFGLLHAQELALRAGAPLVVCHCLSPTFLDAARRQYDFLVQGLLETRRDLEALAIPLAQLTGDPAIEVPVWLTRLDPLAVVTDFDPLRIKRRWVAAVAAALQCPFREVDSRNVVPCRAASDKREYGARTIRPKIHRLLPEFLIPPPDVVRHPHVFAGDSPRVDVAEAAASAAYGSDVPPIDWLTPGPRGAEGVLEQFVSRRLARYAATRNDPLADSQSNLSPYLHFGQLSALRVALAVQEANAPPDCKEAFLEELIVRRELSDNYCLHTPDYDSLEGCPGWALATLEKHRFDPGRVRYEPDELERGRTHDPLWNAAQMEMVKTGKMHGYMRMYWAKKLLEWSGSAGEAMRAAVFLNDSFELDGRDPNGYAGIAWSICGLHDRPWPERPVIGTVRAMSAAGCARKFDVRAYIRMVEELPDRT